MALATNWIFDHPELDLETPLEEEMRRLEAEEEEAFDDEDEEGLFTFYLSPVCLHFCQQLFVYNIFRGRL